MSLRTGNCLLLAPFFEVMLRDSVQKFNQWRQENPEYEEIDLIGANLTSLNLEGANFDGAKLNGAQLTGSNLRNASFCKAKLGTVCFLLTDVTGANFKDSDLSGANFFGAKGLTKAMQDEIFLALEAGWRTAENMVEIGPDGLPHKKKGWEVKSK